MKKCNCNWRDKIWLVLRVAFGIRLITFGRGKLLWWPARWEMLGGVMEPLFGISWWTVFWWFMLMFAEFFGWIFIWLWLLTRFMSALLFIWMVVASLVHINGVFWGSPTMAIIIGVLALIVLIIWPWKISLDNKIFKQ